MVLALAQTKDLIHDAEVALTRGEDRQKVAAAGELEQLLRLRELLQTRLAEVDRRAANRETLFSWFRQEWFNLRFHLESWIAQG